LKVASKMGISTVQSYRAAQIFEAIGISKDVVDRYFTKTASRINGVGLDVIAEETLARHRHAFPPIEIDTQIAVLPMGGQHQWRKEGEYHMWNPETVAQLQHAVRVENYKTFKDYPALLNDEARNRCTLRGLLNFKKGAQPSIPLDEVEPAKE